MNVICTIVIILGNGYHSVVDLRGVVLKEGSDNLYVDFSEEFIKRGYNNQPMVQIINENSCLYTK